jgi:hypothetical protein
VGIGQIKLSTGLIKSISFIFNLISDGISSSRFVNKTHCTERLFSVNPLDDLTRFIQCSKYLSVATEKIVKLSIDK